MKITPTPLPGLMVLEPARHGDARGFFSESWSRETLAARGIDLDFCQDNHSLSAAAPTLRGLHFQAPPRAQDKLVRCGRGALYDVAVDIRRGSPTYGQWWGILLTPGNGLQLLVPAGFAHGFVTRVPDTEILYKCTDTYAPETEGALNWADPDIGIDWNLPRGEDPILSAKDAAAGLLRNFETPFDYAGPFPWEDRA